MTFSDIAAVSGKPGLYKVVKPTRTGLILESMDASKTKLITGPHHRVSLLAEISIFTTDTDKTVPLEDVFIEIKKKFNDDPGVDAKSDKDELFAFLKEIVADYDPERVYTSDVKKMLNWYAVISKEAADLLVKKKEETKEVKKEDKKDAKAEVKPTVKKAPAKGTTKNVKNMGGKSAPQMVRKSSTQRKSGG
jgi:hypothetical protein